MGDRLINESLNLKFDNELVKICDLYKVNKPIITKVKMDEFTNEVGKNFDYDFNGETKFYPYEFNDIIKELDFNILVIVGASGSGKSTFSKYFGEEEKIIWDNSKAIISNFESKEEGIEKLCAVGLSSIPTWVKPRNVLSVGEGFRADLARKLKSNCVVDEFTSTIDRNVALSCSKSISKYIRSKNLKNCVFVSCHKDFIDTLCPDYIIDLDDECVYDARGLATRKFELSIYEKTNKDEIWRIFRQHHYLNGDLNKACRLYVAYLDNELVAMCAILPMPNGYIENGFRIHRLVVLPDYQGLGIGTNFLEQISKLYASVDKKIYIRTSHIKLYNYFRKSKDWKETARSGTISPPTGIKSWKSKDRIAYSFKYIGDKKSILDNKYLERNKVKNEQGVQLSIFDFSEEERL